MDHVSNSFQPPGHAAAPAAAERLLIERTTAALRESEERFRSAFEHAAIGMALVGLDGRWLKINPAVCEILGYREDELLATSFQAVTHPDDLEADLAHVRALIAGETRSYQMTKRYFHKRGHVVWALLSVSLVRDEAGAPSYFISQIQDVTEQKRAEEALASRERQFRSLAQNAPVGIFQTDAEGNNLYVNERWCGMTGLAPDQARGTGWAKAIHPDDRARVFAAWVRASTAGEEFYDEYRYRSEAGRVVWVQVYATPVRDEQGGVAGYIGTSTDVTERKRTQWLEGDRRQVLELVAQDRPLRDVLHRLLGLVEHQADGIRAALLMVDDGQIRIEASPSLPTDFTDALRHRGLPLAAELSALIGDRASPSPVAVSSIAKEPLWEDLRPLATAAAIKTCWASPIRTNDGLPLGLLILFSRSDRIPGDDEIDMIDMACHLATISIQHHQTTQQLDHLVRHDTLTGLPNRILFEDRLQQAMVLADRNAKRVALMLLDIDHFKDVNDTLGHDAGDQLLLQFARRIKELLRDTDTLARIGGDEFLLLLPELDDRGGASCVADKIVASLAEPFDLDGEKVTISSSIGIALYPEDGRETQTLQKIADREMYRIKRGGRNGYSLAPEPAAVGG